MNRYGRKSLGKNGDAAQKDKQEGEDGLFTHITMRELSEGFVSYKYTHFHRRTKGEMPVALEFREEMRILQHINN